ncbi:MAG: hydantoinase/oxoprolinase family protein, partial [Alphaproteobacteria bacterium]|nr:hydantoinase/oxoprolinase family protein [Alphaproteobacteria bacterium]
GGSIARVADGTLSVGPQSAGADPGPAAYGRGGERATVTDAHVVLGHLPAKLLGGRMGLDADAARRVIEREVGGPLGLSVEAAARGVLAIIDNNMMGALRIVSVERGHDPRDFTLVPFGGAGPLHGCALANLLGITRILVPPAPGVLCADGLLAADLKADFSRTLPKAGRVDLAVARSIYAELEQQADDWLAAENVAPGDRQRARVALMRYHGQGGELAVGWVDGVAEVEAAFATAHKALYGFTLDAPIELVTLRVEARGRMPAPPRPTLSTGSGAKPVGSTKVHFATGPAQVPLYQRAMLGAGDRLEGPAIVSQLDATTLVLPGWRAEVHYSGALVLSTIDGAD